MSMYKPVSKSVSPDAGPSCLVSGLLSLRGSVFALAVIILMSVSSLAAQSSKDEFTMLKGYALPEHAVPMERIVIADSLATMDEKLFSGIAWEKYPNEKLQRVVYYKKGKQHGPMYVWYPDGTPQMSINYRRGRLHGRFLGWYAHGGVIYDMVITAKGYGGDLMDDDGFGGGDDREDDSPEGDYETNEGD